MSLPVIESPFGFAITVAPAGVSGLPIVFSTNGFGVAVKTVTSGGLPVSPEGPVINLSASGFLESATTNTQVGLFSVTGGTGTYTFTLTNTAGGKFTVAGTNGVQLRTVGTFDYETQSAYTITVRADNGAGSVITSNYTISVLNVDDVTPVFTSPTTASVAENATLAHTLVATVDAAATVSYSVVGGLDQTRFEISGNTLRWLGDGTKDFEAPNDSNTDNQYVVQVRATSAPGGLTTNQTITVTVTNVDDVTPVFTSSASPTVAENATLSHTLTATKDASATIAFSIVGGADAARFEISGTTLRWLGNGTKDYELPDDANADNQYIVQVRCTSSPGGLIANQTITVSVTDVAEGASIQLQADFSSANNEALLGFI